MTDHTPNAWEPDARKMGNWRAMFDTSRRDGQPPGEPVATPAQDEPPDDGTEALDLTEYRPWILQRGTRPVMMLHMRRNDPKSGLWMGWQLSYAHLIAVEYVGAKMLSLDFGSRQFVIEGNGLDELARHLQSGNVLMVQEYAARVWPSPNQGRDIQSIRPVNAHEQFNTV